MSELISFRGCGVGYLAKELGRNRAVKDKISVEELNFFDRLPSSDWRWAGCGRWEMGIVSILWLCMRVRTVRITWGQYGNSVVVLILVMRSWIPIQRVIFLRMRRVWLGIIRIVVLFRGYGVVLASVSWRCLRAMLRIVGLVVAIGVVYVFNRVLFAKSASKRCHLFQLPQTVGCTASRSLEAIGICKGGGCGR